jgi:hypothetical protein
MGLISWLFGKHSRVTVRDLIWLSNEARNNGIALRIKGSMVEMQSLLVVAHFPATLAAFGEHVVSHEWPYVGMPDVLTPTAALALAAEYVPARLLLGLARNLQVPESLSESDELPSPLPVIVLERHPVRRYDDRVVAFAEGLGDRAEVEFHTSFDDPLMKMYAGDRARGILRRMGQKEDEAMDGGMLSRSLKGAQRKLEARLNDEQDADSAEEWVRKNWNG